MSSCCVEAEKGKDMRFIGVMAAFVLLGAFVRAGDAPAPRFQLRLDHADYQSVCEVAAHAQAYSSHTSVTLALVAENGYYLSSSDVAEGRKQSGGMVLFSDVTGQQMINENASQDVYLQYDGSLRPAQIRYAMRISDLKPIQFRPGAMRVTGAFPVRKVTGYKKVEVKPLSVLKQKNVTFDFPGGTCVVSLQPSGTQINFESGFYAPVSFYDELGQPVKHNGSGFGMKYYLYTLPKIPEGGSLEFSLPETAELLDAPFDFKDINVDELAKTAGVPAENIEARRAARDSSLQVYAAAPFLEGVPCRVGWACLTSEFHLTGENGAIAMQPRYPQNLMVALEFDENGKPSTKIRSTEFFVPEVVRDDTGKDLLSAQFAAERSLHGSNGVTYYTIHLLRLLPPDEKATKIARIKGVAYCRSMQGQPCRVSVDLSDIPLLHK